jgi:hypothetical protein
MKKTKPYVSSRPERPSNRELEEEAHETGPKASANDTQSIPNGGLRALAAGTWNFLHLF